MTNRLLPHHERVLVDLYAYTYPHGEMCIYYRTIALRLEVEERKIRLIVRSLARKGYAEYVRGLINEQTWLMAGSGHCITPKGIEYVKEHCS